MKITGLPTKYNAEMNHNDIKNELAAQNPEIAGLLWGIKNIYDINAGGKKYSTIVIYSNEDSFGKLLLLKALTLITFMRM